jgi:hypothetical protein
MNDILDGYIAVSDQHGIYCPQVFARRTPHEQFPTISEESWGILEEGPDHEFYWDVWAYEFEGQKSVDGGTIYQDGDVWIVYAWKEDESE